MTTTKTILCTNHPHYIIYCSSTRYEELSQHKWFSVERGNDIYAINEVGAEILINGETVNA